VTSYAEQRIPYPAAHDYGSRDGWPTLAVTWHMAEGRDVAQYLGRDPLRGVSVHYTIEQETARWQDGQVVRCLPEDRISGSIDPRSIRLGDDPGGYYGASHARAAIGRYWPETSPNLLIISVEVAGYARQGPTAAQQRSMVALWDDIRSRYPKVLPLGHRDWQDVKPCPGRTAALKAAFTAMGGHGTDHSEVRYVSTRDYVSGRVCTVRKGARLFDYPGGLAIGTLDPPRTRDYLGTDPSGDFALIGSELDGQPRTAWVRKGAVSDIRNAAAPPTDCREAIAAERERVKAAAITAIEAM